MVLRRVLLSASESARLASLAGRAPVARSVVRRFVAGETLDEAVAVTRTLNQAGFRVALDHLGEAVGDPDEALAAQDAYAALLDAIATEQLDASVSVKLTHLGLDVSPDLCHQLVTSVAVACRGAGTHLTVDMEGSRLTQTTVDLVLRLRKEGHDHVGCAIQAYLLRSPADVKLLTDAGASLRLCKGAYDEPATIALQEREAIRDAFVDLARMVLSGDTYARFATHDDVLIHRLVTLASDLSATDAYELQMLYGVREPLQRDLATAGQPVRVYVPYGRAWYPYFVRRLAERPANVAFLLRALAGRR